MAASVQQGMIDTSQPFDMIIGAKGSPTQLIFNTIFLQDTHIGNVPESLYEQLLEDDRAAKIIPFGFGDNYRGYRIVGTTADIFELRPGFNASEESPIFQLAEGRFFEEAYEVVVGSDVARKLGLKPGDEFNAIHGIVQSIEAEEEDEHHDEAEDHDDEEDHDEEEHHDESEVAEGHHHHTPYTVVGILKRMHRPYDNGIFTPLESVWEMHGSEHHDVTAVMVTPKDYTGLYQMYQEINNGNEAQAALPGAVMGSIFDMLGQSAAVLTVVSYIVLAMALITIVLSLYWSVLTRTRENAILRAVGAGRRDILVVVLIESAIIVFSSIIFGLLFGHALAYLVSTYLQQTMAIYSPVSFMPQEIRLMAAIAVLAIAASLLPAINAYKTDVAKNLMPK